MSDTNRCPACGDPWDLSEAEFERVKAERDALLAACEAAISVMTGPEYGGAPGTTDALDRLRAAVRKARGGEG